MAPMLRVLFMLAGLAALAVGANEAPTGDEARDRARDHVRDGDAEVYRQLQLRGDADVRQAFRRRIEAVEGEDVAARIARLDISPADFAWAFAAERKYSEDVKAGNLTAEGFLESPEMQIAFKLVANVATAPYSGARLIANSAEYEDALFVSFAADVAPLAHLREVGASVEDLLWLRAVRRFDQAMLADGEATAGDLLSMPRYWLARKIMADAVAATMAERVRCSDPNAAYYVAELCGRGWCDTQFGTNMRACEIGQAACEMVPLRNCTSAFGLCFRVADCASRHCSAGTVPQNWDCGDLEGDGGS